MASSSQDEQALHSFAQPEDDDEEEDSSNNSNTNGENNKNASCES
jgi:hypothetical protein